MNYDFIRAIFNLKISPKLLEALWWRRMEQTNVITEFIEDGLLKDSKKRLCFIVLVLLTIVVPYPLALSTCEFTVEFLLTAGLIHVFAAIHLVKFLFRKRFCYERVAEEIYDDLRQLLAYIPSAKKCVALDELEAEALRVLTEIAADYVTSVNSNEADFQNIPAKFSSLDKLFALCKKNLLFVGPEKITEVGYFIRLANSKQS